MEEKLDAYIEIISALKSINIEPEKLKIFINTIDVQIFNAVKKRLSYLKNISVKLKDGNNDEEDDKMEEKGEESEKMKRKEQKLWVDESLISILKRKNLETLSKDKDRENFKRTKYEDKVVKKSEFLPPELVLELIQISPRESQAKIFIRLRKVNKKVSSYFNDVASDALIETSKIVAKKDYQGLYKLSRTLRFRLNTFLPNWGSIDKPCGLFPLISQFIGEILVEEELVRRDWFLGLLMIIPSLSVFENFYTQEDEFMVRLGLSKTRFINYLKLTESELLMDYFLKLIKENVSILKKWLKDGSEEIKLKELKSEVILTHKEALFLIYKFPMVFELDFEYLLSGPNDLYNEKIEFDIYFWINGSYINSSNSVKITSERYNKVSNVGTYEEKRKLALVTHILLNTSLELKNVEKQGIIIDRYLDVNVKDFSVSIKNSKSLNIDFNVSELDIEVLNSERISILNKYKSKLRVEMSNMVYIKNIRDKVLDSEFSISNSKNILCQLSTTDVDLKNIKESSEIRILFSIIDDKDEDYRRIKKIFKSGKVFQIYWDYFFRNKVSHMLGSKYPNEKEFWKLLETYNLKF